MHNACELKTVESILQNVSLVKVKFVEVDVWSVFAVVSSENELITVLVNDSLDNLKNVIVRKEILLKFKHDGYEYVVNGEFHKQLSNLIEFKMLNCFRFMEKRSSIRYEAELKVYNNNTYIGITKNISECGFFLETSEDLSIEEKYFLTLETSKGLKLTPQVKIMRKINCKNNFLYGVNICKVSIEDKKKLRQEIKICENKYFNPIFSLRKNDKDISIDSKVAIFSENLDAGFKIKESLLKLGVYHIDVINDYSYAIEFVNSEKPTVIIVDFSINSKQRAETLLKLLNKIIDDKKIFILKDFDEKSSNSPNVVYKPLIEGELESKIFIFL